MKVVLITGYENSGKSTICKILKERIVVDREDREDREDRLDKKDNIIIFDKYPKDKKDCVGIYKVNDKYIGISSYGDSEEMLAHGFLTIIDEATSKNIKLDTMFFTSRSKGRTYKKAISLASEHDSNYYNFFSNKIQTVKTSDETIRQQKSQFLDFVLNVSNTVI
ncbi:hypothetical protein [Pseudolactococcus piscium]|nr:hypothetical protein [Lactococcus piscium]